MATKLIADARWLTFAWANVLRNRRRSATTITIAAVCSAALLIAGGFTLYTYQSLAESSARMTGHLVLGTPEQFTGDEDVPLQHGLKAADDLQRRVLADPQVRHVLPRVEFSGLVSNGDKTAVMMAVGVDPDSEFAIKGPFMRLSAGRLLAGDDHAQVMLGEGLARNLHAAPRSSLTLLATTVDGTLNALDVTVAGTFTTGVTEIDRRLVYVDLHSAQQLLATDRISSLGVFLDRVESTDAVQARLQALLPGTAAQTWVEQAPFYRSVKDLYNRIFGGLGLVIALIVVFVMGNAMAMAVVERTREIGTLRVLGTSPAQIVSCLTLEGLLLGACGALIGALLAGSLAGLLLLFPLQMPPPPGRSTGYPLQIAVDGALYVGTMVAILLICTAVSAWVARRAMRHSIVEALSHT